MLEEPHQGHDFQFASGEKVTLDQDFTAHCPLTKTVWQYGWLFIDTVEAKRIYLRGFFKNRG